ncbi:ABC transporter permease subunit [Bacillus sp. T33-2]|uniref:ABC transporter permease subunit n=1 Tax=Bacillus sp. T33-2 TaxID=2054168 RepID=UPI000C774FFA|nr:ABC transporter permease subunit [Bacillus sp. T33-2]PLR99707.1 ABC transporter permease [Bacillus sp. T33-2]
MLRSLQQIIIIVFLILFLAALPATISVNSEKKSIDWAPERLTAVYTDFFKTLGSGTLGTYQLGQQVRNIEDDMPDNFMTSLKIMLVGVNAGIILSLIFGIFISRFRLTRIFSLFLNVLAAIPDFILIVLGLILAVKFYKYTGVRIISLRPDAGALNIWFPMILLSLAPTLYLFKLVAVKYYQTSGEDFVRTAVAKGMKLDYINLQHIYKNVEPFIIAELTKVISLAIGNLFIIEYLLNVSGITKFIFQSNDIQPIAVGLFSMLLISMIVYLSVRLLLYVFKRGLIYE